MTGRVAKAIGLLNNLHTTCLFHRKATPRSVGWWSFFSGQMGRKGFSELQGRGLKYVSCAPGPGVNDGMGSQVFQNFHSPNGPSILSVCVWHVFRQVLGVYSKSPSQTLSLGLFMSQPLTLPLTGPSRDVLHAVLSICLHIHIHTYIMRNLRFGIFVTKDTYPFCDLVLCLELSGRAHHWSTPFQQEH